MAKSLCSVYWPMALRTFTLSFPSTHLIVLSHYMKSIVSSESEIGLANTTLTYLYCASTGQSNTFQGMFYYQSTTLEPINSTTDSARATECR